MVMVDQQEQYQTMLYFKHSNYLSAMGYGLYTKASSVFKLFAEQVLNEIDKNNN